MIDLWMPLATSKINGGIKCMNPKISTSAVGQALMFYLTRAISFWKEDRVWRELLWQNYSSHPQMSHVYQGLTWWKWICFCWKCGCKHATIFGIQCIFETSKWGHDRVICYVYCIICTYLEIKTTSLLRSLHSNNRVPQSLQMKSKSIPIPIQV